MATVRPIDYSVSLAASGTSPDLTPPPGYTVQEVVAILAAGVVAAYTAYTSGNSPSLTGYGNVEPIYVYEYGTKELFGFAASANDNTHNIVVLRGTQTDEEATYDLYSWGVNVACAIPVNPASTTPPPQDYGYVNQGLYDFYAQGPNATYDESMASYFNSAVQAVAAASSASLWYVAGHSLGGPMATLGAWDAYASGSFEANGASPQPTLVTFGGLHLGDATFVTDYIAALPQGLRIANQCDFVPSLVALEPSSTAPSDPYAALGQPGTFVWQNWDDWANHSMTGVYQPMVTYAGQNNDPDYWSLIGFGPQTYPQAG